jgi:hypothetical protein
MPQIPITTRVDNDRPLVKVVNEAIASPPVGEGFSITIPQGYRSSLVSLRMRITCDANVAARAVRLRVLCSDLLVWEMSHGSVLIASCVYVLCAGPGFGLMNLAAATFFAQWPTPPGLTLQEGDVINVTVDNIQVGDQIDQIALQTLSQFVAE